MCCYGYGIATAHGKNAVGIVYKCVLIFLWCSSLDCHDGKWWYLKCELWFATFELQFAIYIWNANCMYIALDKHGLYVFGDWNEIDIMHIYNYSCIASYEIWIVFATIMCLPCMYCRVTYFWGYQF